MATSFDLLQGFFAAMSAQNLLFCLIGSILGTLAGVLPGIGPTAGMAILLPITATIGAEPAIIMLSGIYYGAMYGGSSTAILINVPGEAASITTALDGYQLALQGRPGVALAIAAIGSFLAGMIGLGLLTFFAPPMARIALFFGPPEYFGLMILSLSVVIGLAGKSLRKGLISAIFGFIISIIGLDPITGSLRLTFHQMPLYSGIDFISVVVGLFAISEVLVNTEKIGTDIYVSKVGRLMPTWAEFRESSGAMLRGGLVGFSLGLLPGATATSAAFLAYDLEKKISKHPEKFGHGAIEGVAAPESANNATCSANFIPLLALGIPASPAMAVLVGALMMYGLQPGPMLFKQHADFAWAVIASMFIGNVMCLILNLPLVGLWAKIIKVPYTLLATFIMLFSFIGTFSIRNNMFDVWVALIFGVVGYFMRKLDYPVAPLILCLILGPIVESSFRQSLEMTGGNPSIFFARPGSFIFILLAVASVIISLMMRARAAKGVIDQIVGDQD